MKKDIIAEGVNCEGDRYVLAWLPKKKEFVSWFVGLSSNEETAYYHGQYYKDLTLAIQDFKKRICISKQGSLMDFKIPIAMIANWNTDQLELYFKLKEK